MLSPGTIRCIMDLVVSGLPHADELLNQSDLYIVLGSRLSDMTICNLKPENHPAHLIQFDSDPAFVGKILHSQTLHITGDLKDNLQFLLGTLTEYEAPKRVHGSRLYGPLPTLPNLSLASILDELSDMLPYDHTLFVDDGSHGFHAVQRYKVKNLAVLYLTHTLPVWGMPLVWRSEPRQQHQTRRSSVLQATDAS